MPKPCSLELRTRVVDAVESGASRREAADCFEVSPSSAIKWMQRRQAFIAPKPSGQLLPLLFALIARQPDRTEAMDRRANNRVAQSLPKTGQRLRKSQSHGARLLASWFNAPHALKAIQSELVSGRIVKLELLGGGP